MYNPSCCSSLPRNTREELILYKATECILDTIGGSVLLSGRESEIDILRYLHHIVHCIVYSFLTGDRGELNVGQGFVHIGLNWTHQVNLFKLDGRWPHSIGKLLSQWVP